MNTINRTLCKIAGISMLAVITIYLAPMIQHTPDSYLKGIASCEQSSIAYSQKIQSIRPAKNIITQKNSAAVNKITELKNQIITLNALIESLRQDQKMPQAIANVAVFEESSELHDLNNTEEELLIAEQHTEAELINEFEQRLALEAYDTAWAGSLETQLQDIFTDQPQLEGNELLEVSCRSTLCRIEIDHQDEKSESELISSIASNNELMSSIDDFYAYRMTNDTDDEENVDVRLQSVFYIARKGHKLAMSEL